MNNILILYVYCMLIVYMFVVSTNLISTDNNYYMEYGISNTSTKYIYNI